MSQAFDLAIRFWDELIARPSGPMAFRFILQPTMASIMALRDGIKDARADRAPYLWTILHDPDRRADRLYEGILAVFRVLALGVVMDTIYQVTVLHGLRPLQTIVVTIVLAFIPYLILRGPIARIAKRLIKRNAPGYETQPVRRR